MRLPIPDLEREELAAFRSVRDHHHAHRLGLFVVEGRLAVETLLDTEHALHALLVDDRKEPGLEALLARVPEETPIWVAPKATLRALVGFNFHRGILAAAQRPEPRSAGDTLAALAPGAHRVLVLEGLTDASNVGAVLRNAAAFGASAALLDARCCDPLHRRSIRVSQGFALKLPLGRAEDASALRATLRDAGFVNAALTPAEDAPAIDDWAAPPRVALWLGTEGDGLPAQSLDAADQRLRIPMAPGCDSINVAAASAVALHVLRLKSPAR